MDDTWWGDRDVALASKLILQEDTIVSILEERSQAQSALQVSESLSSTAVSSCHRVKTLSASFQLLRAAMLPSSDLKSLGPPTSCLRCAITLVHSFRDSTTLAHIIQKSCLRLGVSTSTSDLCGGKVIGLQSRVWSYISQNLWILGIHRYVWHHKYGNALRRPL